MNFIINIIKTIMAGLAMQHSADYLSNNEKQTYMKKAVEHKQQASQAVSETHVGEAIGTDSVVLNQG